jgi:hypothetical protein
MPANASASDKSLKTALAKWSHQIQLEARGIALSARLRHPRRMTNRAHEFRLTALHAQRALSSQKPTTARGRRAKTLALNGFRNYAVVGHEWELSGKARLGGSIPEATKHAHLASSYAKKGNSQLVSAGKLLR